MQNSLNLPSAVKRVFQSELLSVKFVLHFRILARIEVVRIGGRLS